MMRLRFAFVILLAAMLSSNSVSGRDHLKGQDRDQLKGPDDGPCGHRNTPRGKAKGHHKRCSDGGSSSGVARGDFNGDGIGDLAVGVPFEDIGNVRDAGAVNVIYGSGTGLTGGGGSTGVPRNPRTPTSVVPALVVETAERVIGPTAIGPPSPIHRMSEHPSGSTRCRC